MKEVLNIRMSMDHSIKLNSELVKPLSYYFFPIYTHKALHFAPKFKKLVNLMKT